MNAGIGTTRTPVENIFYSDRRRMIPGVYTLYVHQWSRRESQDSGFEVEIDFLGNVHSFHVPQSTSTGGHTVVAKFKYSHDSQQLEFIEALPASTNQKSVTHWGIQTNQFHKVKILLNSPNHWDNNPIQLGNLHHFFLLENCINDEPARSLFNEFLHESLNPHRKVMEMVGAKLQTDQSPTQLSGLGFSHTQRNSLILRVTGSFTCLIKVIF